MRVWKGDCMGAHPNMPRHGSQRVKHKNRFTPLGSLTQLAEHQSYNGKQSWAADIGDNVADAPPQGR